MATKIYLGNPPQYVIDWIKAHSKPVGNPKTKITFTDGTLQEYDWSGEITKRTMVDAGLLVNGNPTWLKNPQIVEIGTNVTSIGDQAFYYCSSLTNVTISDSVTSIGSMTFRDCSSLTSVTIGSGVMSIGNQAFLYCGLTSMTFSGKDMATVQGMANYSWDLTTRCVIHCTDGDIMR